MPPSVGASPTVSPSVGASPTVSPSMGASPTVTSEAASPSAGQSAIVTPPEISATATPLPSEQPVMETASVSQTVAPSLTVRGAVTQSSRTADVEPVSPTAAAAVNSEALLPSSTSVSGQTGSDTATAGGASSPVPETGSEVQPTGSGGILSVPGSLGKRITPGTHSLRCQGQKCKQKARAGLGGGTGGLPRKSSSTEVFLDLDTACIHFIRNAPRRSA